MFWHFDRFLLIFISSLMTSKAVNFFTRINKNKRNEIKLFIKLNKVKMVRLLKKQIKIQKARSCFSFGNCVVNHLCCLHLESNKDVSCFASSNPILACQPGKEAPCPLQCSPLERQSTLLNAHEIFTFQGLSSNSRCHKIFVGHLGKCYDATREQAHPFWFWTFNSSPICGHFGVKDDCCESGDS